MFRTPVAIGLAAALALLLVPSAPARAQSDLPAVARMTRLIDRTFERFAARAERTVNGALRRVSILERQGASPERIQAVIDQTKFALEVQAAAMRGDLDDLGAATLLVIDRQERSRVRNGTLPTLDFGAARRGVEARVDRLKARGDALLDKAFVRLDAAAPEPEEEEMGF